MKSHVLANCSKTLEGGPSPLKPSLQSQSHVLGKNVFHGGGMVVCCETAHESVDKVVATSLAFSDSDAHDDRGRWTKWACEKFVEARLGELIRRVAAPSYY